MTHTTTDAAEARAREVLAQYMPKPHLAVRVKEGGDLNNGVFIRPSQAIAAMLAFATAEAASGAGEREDEHGDIATIAYMMGAKAERDRLASLPPATDSAMVERRQLAEGLARYMDTKAFVAKKVGKEQAERLKVRRSIAIDRARAAIRFFEKPENFARLEARIDRASAPTIPATGETVPDRFANDAAAKALYDSWSYMTGWVPWVERGNSDMQERARLEATIPATGHAATEGEGA